MWYAPPANKWKMVGSANMLSIMAAVAAEWEEMGPAQRLACKDVVAGGALNLGRGVAYNTGQGNVQGWVNRLRHFPQITAGDSMLIPAGCYHRAISWPGAIAAIRIARKRKDRG